VLALFLFFVHSEPAHADPQLGECSGILHADRDSVIIGGGEEGEGICIINKSQENFVLSKCRIGQFCRVKGVVDECRDSGECSEMLRVTSAARTDGQEQAATKTTLWYHNGSLVSLVAEGSIRKFFYKEPREEMLAVGARPGSLLFSGTSDNRKYVGTAFIFNQRCGQVPYQVSGPILDNYKRVVLRGRAPVIGSDCRVKKYINDTLEFTLIQGSSS
jgi:hypothetical protein